MILRLKIKELLQFNFEKVVEHFEKEYGREENVDLILEGGVIPTSLYIPSREGAMPELMMNLIESENHEKKLYISFSQNNEDKTSNTMFDLNSLSFSYENEKLTFKDKYNETEVLLKTENVVLREAFVLLVSSFITGIIIG